LSYSFKIPELLGHSSSKTTEIYTQVSTKNLQQIRSPFDDSGKLYTLDRGKKLRLCIQIGELGEFYSGYK
jgi:hypothetical protein